MRILTTRYQAGRGFSTGLFHSHQDLSSLPLLLALKFMVLEGRGDNGGVCGTDSPAVDESTHDGDQSGCHDSDCSALRWGCCGYSIMGNVVVLQISLNVWSPIFVTSEQQCATSSQSIYYTSIESTRFVKVHSSHTHKSSSSCSNMILTAHSLICL